MPLSSSLESKIEQSTVSKAFFRVMNTPQEYSFLSVTLNFLDNIIEGFRDIGLQLLGILITSVLCTGIIFAYFNLAGYTPIWTDLFIIVASGKEKSLQADLKILTGVEYNPERISSSISQGITGLKTKEPALKSLNGLCPEGIQVIILLTHIILLTVILFLRCNTKLNQYYHYQLDCVICSCDSLTK